MSGKGDMPRPFSVKREKFEENFDRIFNKKKKSPKNKTAKQTKS